VRRTRPAALTTNAAPAAIRRRRVTSALAREASRWMRTGEVKGKMEVVSVTSAEDGVATTVKTAGEEWTDKWMQTKPHLTRPCFFGLCNLVIFMR